MPTSVGRQDEARDRFQPLQWPLAPCGVVEPTQGGLVGQQDQLVFSREVHRAGVQGDLPDPLGVIGGNAAGIVVGGPKDRDMQRVEGRVDDHPVQRGSQARRALRLAGRR